MPLSRRASANGKDVPPPEELRRLMQSQSAGPGYGEGDVIPSTKGSQSPAAQEALATERLRSMQQLQDYVPLQTYLDRAKRMQEVPIMPERGFPRSSYGSEGGDVPLFQPPAAPGRTLPPTTAQLMNTSSMPAAVKALDLTPQEQNLYKYHLTNLAGSGKIIRPSGQISTVEQAVVEGPGGKFYSIPTVWDGKQLPPAEARKRAGAIGWSNWPTYSSARAADQRYQDIHPYIERDTAAWQRRAGRPT